MLKKVDIHLVKICEIVECFAGGMCLLFNSH